MKKSIKLLLSLGIIGLLFLGGCSNFTGTNSGIESFSLTRLESSESDAENPDRYIVAPEEKQDKIILFVPALGEKIGTNEQIEYELESATVTDDEIIIQFNGEKHHFDRLSESVAENEVGIQYQYRSENTE